MKKVVLTLSSLLLAVCFHMADAQIKTPAASPAAKFSQTAGLTDITIEYSRPSAKGRVVFGGLVPYGEMWRTGANKNSMITFSDKVTVGGMELAAGSYAIFTKPGQSSWEILLYTDTENWGTPENFDEEKVAARITAPVQSLNHPVETFTIGIDGITNDKCTVVISWEMTSVAFEVSLNTHDVVSKSITKTMAGPDANDYYAAGRYYLESGQDAQKAYEWIHRSNEMDPDKYWKLRQEALALAALQRYADAITVAEQSKALAVKAGNKDYERMNSASIKEWSLKTSRKN
ncbi:MAG: hypothetical protein RLY31_2232 [Bacteroidota bacterium]|jgi:hypothetical protein